MFKLTYVLPTTLDGSLPPTGINEGNFLALELHSEENQASCDGCDVASVLKRLQSFAYSGLLIKKYCLTWAYEIDKSDVCFQAAQLRCQSYYNAPNCGSFLSAMQYSTCAAQESTLHVQFTTVQYTVKYSKIQ